MSIILVFVAVMTVNPNNAEAATFFYDNPSFQTLNNGEQNQLTLRIFDKKGVQNIESVEIKLNLVDEQNIQKNFTIIWNQKFNGTQITTVNDPDEILAEVEVVGKPHGIEMTVTFEFTSNMKAEIESMITNVLSRPLPLIVEKETPEKEYPITMHGIDRNHPLFNTYKEGQLILAQQKLLEILGGNPIGTFEESERYN